MPKSIRWRLPLTYASIALLATLALGAVLLITLRGYYAEAEYDHLSRNADVISQTVMELQQRNLTPDNLAEQIRTLSFLAQTRIKLLDTQRTLIVNSGAPNRTLVSLNFDPGAKIDPLPTPPDVLPVPAQPTSQTESVGIAGQSALGIGQLHAEPSPDSGSVTYFRSMTTPAGKDMVFVAAAPSMFGFDLKGAGSTGGVSDQTINTPLFNQSAKLDGYLVFSEGPAYGSQILEGVARNLIGAGLLATVLAALAGWFFSKHISEPVLSLTDVTSRMSEGDLSLRVDLQRDDEFGALGHAFNHMAVRIETTISTLRRFVADAAHELHTPLTALYADLELAATEIDEARRLLFIERARAQAKRLETLTDSLLDLSRIESGTRREQPHPVDLTSLAHEIGEIYASRAEQVDLAFTLDTPDHPLLVFGDLAQLRRAIANLLDNAIKFTPRGGTVRIGLTQCGDWVELRVCDTGVGIPQEDIPLLFQRFHRGRNVAAYPGSGLGLAILKAIVDAHHGQVCVESATSGTQFALLLPVISP